MVDAAKPDYVEHRDRCRMIKIVWVFSDDTVEILPVFKSGQNISTDIGFSEYKKIPGHSAAVITQLAGIKAYRSLASIRAALHAETVFVTVPIRDPGLLYEVRLFHSVRPFYFREEKLCFLILHNKLFVMVEQHDALVDVLEYGHRERHEHVFMPVFERSPVNYDECDGIAEYRPVEESVQPCSGRVQEYSIDDHDSSDRDYDEPVLVLILLRCT